MSSSPTEAPKPTSQFDFTGDGHTKLTHTSGGERPGFTGSDCTCRVTPETPQLQGAAWVIKAQGLLEGQPQDGGPGVWAAWAELVDGSQEAL